MQFTYTSSLSLYITQIAELCHEIEDRDDALAKAREAAHKAQLQKYQVRFAPFYSKPNLDSI